MFSFFCHSGSFEGQCGGLLGSIQSNSGVTWGQSGINLLICGSFRGAFRVFARCTRSSIRVYVRGYMHVFWEIYIYRGSICVLSGVYWVSVSNFIFWLFIVYPLFAKYLFQHTFCVSLLVKLSTLKPNVLAILHHFCNIYAVTVTAITQVLAYKIIEKC